VVRFTLIALPLLLHDGLWAFGMLLYGFLYAHLGTDALAIMTTLGTLESILISLFFGLAVACSTLLGHRLGAEEYEEAWQHSQLFLLLAPIGALLVGTAVWLLQGNLLQWVGNLPGELMTEAGQVLAIMCLGMLLKVFNMVGIVGVLRSGGTSTTASSSTSSACGASACRSPGRGQPAGLAPLLGGGGGPAGGALQGAAGAAPHSPAALAAQSGAGIREERKAGKCGVISMTENPALQYAGPLFNQRRVRRQRPCAPAQ
jgi:hypothetical protein